MCENDRDNLKQIFDRKKILIHVYELETYRALSKVQW